MSIYNKVIAGCTLAFLSAVPSLAAADDINHDDVVGFIPDLTADADMYSAPASKESFVFSYGGMLMPTVVREDSSRAKTTTSMNFAKLWLKLTLGGNNYLYLRGKDIYTRVLTSKYSGDKNKNTIDLDEGYFYLSTDQGGVRSYVGRKYYTAGSGIVLNGRGDGAEFLLSSGIVDVKLFGMYTDLIRKDTNTYGLNPRDANDGAKRIFTGGTVEKRFANQTAYILALAQIDRGKEGSTVKSRYQSQYYGVGMKGVPADRLDYVIEGIYETGKSYLLNTDKSKRVSARAAFVSLNYYVDLTGKPALNVQYAYASGDKDRTDATLSNANTSGSDNGFVPFGSFNGGLALRPSLSNLHVFRAGASIFPFAGVDSPRINRMNIGVKYSYYRKDKAEGVIGAGEAGGSSRGVGQAFDVNLRWKFYSDTEIFALYGIFLPGPAYPDSEKKRQTMIAGLILEF
jgi:hypothetical protein